MLKNIFNTFFVRIASAAINLLIAIIISRYLGAEIKGEQGIFLTSVSLLHIIMSVVGLGAIVYLLPRISYTKLIAPTYVWIGIISIVSIFILPIIQPTLSIYSTHIIIITSILTVTNVHISTFIAREKIILANTLTLIQIGLLILSLLLCIFILKQQTVYSYIYSLYISYSTTLLICYIVSYKHFTCKFKEISINTIIQSGKELLHYGFFNQLDIFAQMLSFRFSYYILSSYVGNKEVGVYSVAVSIIESIWLISRSISSVQHARIVNTRDFSANTQLTIQFIKIGSFLTCIAIVVLLLVPNSLYIFIFGNEFFEVKSIIVVLSPGVAFFGTSFMISGLFSGIGKQYINSIAAITGLIVTIAGAYITIPIWGIYGAAATATIAYTATTVVKLVYFKQQAHISWNSFFITKQDIAYGKQEIIARLSKYGLYR